MVLPIVDTESFSTSIGPAGLMSRFLVWPGYHIISHILLYHHFLIEPALLMHEGK